jgi:hypothetical protein
MKNKFYVQNTYLTVLEIGEERGANAPELLRYAYVS